MNRRRIITFLILASILAKLIFLLLSGAYSNVQTFEYEQVAQNLLAGKGFYYENLGSTKYYAGIAPGFPMLCYLVYTIFGHHHLPVVFIQIIVSSLMVIPIFFIARKLFDEKTASLAGILTALFPPFIVYATTKLHTMTIYSFLFALLVWLFLLLKDSPTVKRSCLLGLVAGLTVLFRVTSVAFLFLGLLWFYLASERTASPKSKRRAILIVLCISFLMSLPWGIRSYIIFGKPLLLQTNKGESLWYGNMPGSTGSLFTKDGLTLYETAAKKLPPEFFTMGEIEKGKYLEKLTIGYFKEDPAAFIGRIVMKIFYFWYFSPYQGAIYPKLWMGIYKTYYLLILPLAIFSVIYNFFLKKKDCIDALLIALFLCALTMAHSLYFVEARHRWSIEPFVLIFTANGFIALSHFFMKKGKSGA